MKLRNEFKAGIFIAVSLVLVGFLILIMGRERQIFASQVEFYSEFKDVKGLSVGAPVRLGGIPVGRIAKVGFSKDPSDFRVHVTLLVNEDFLDRIRKDCTVSLETQGLLGDRFMAITPGHSLEMLPEGSHLSSNEAADIAQVLSRAQTVIENTTQISERINKSLEGLNPDIFQNFSSAAKSFSEILASVKSENGFIHRLVYSESDGAKIVDGISKASKDLSEIIGAVKSGKGLLNALIYDTDGGKSVSQFSIAATSIGKASDEVARVLAAAREGNGLIHDLIYTEVPAGSVQKQLSESMKSFSEMAENLRVTSDALAKGTGTLGALIVDPQIYDNLVEVTDGAKRSFLLRQAIRSSLKQ